MKRALFLDRDGVINASITINGKPFPPKNIDEIFLKCDGHWTPKGNEWAAEIISAHLLKN